MVTVRMVEPAQAPSKKRRRPQDSWWRLAAPDLAPREGDVAGQQAGARGLGRVLAFARIQEPQQGRRQDDGDEEG